MFDLLKAALRQRPNQILVGEIRGVEGSVAFGAMQTGHPVMSTFHAASVEKLIQRLCGDPINIPKTYVDNLNLVIIQSAIKRPDGQTVRRMISCNELVGYNAETVGFTFVQMFTWEPVIRYLHVDRERQFVSSREQDRNHARDPGEQENGDLP